MPGKTVIFIAFLLSNVLQARHKVDGIKVRIFGEQEEVLIAESELSRPGLDGQLKTLDDLILENLVYLDAKRMGVIPDPEAMQRHWELIKKQHNLSEKDMQGIAEQSGFTLHEAKMQLGKMSAVNQMFELKVKSGLFVSRQEVEYHYNNHPEYDQAEYEIARAFTPFSAGASKEELRNHLSTLVMKRCDDPLIQWSQPFVLKHDEIAYDKQYIYDMKPGEITQPHEIQYGFELFKLINKIPERLIPLCERYDEIEYELKMPKYAVLMDAYKKELYEKNTVIVY